MVVNFDCDISGRLESIEHGLIQREPKNLRLCTYKDTTRVHVCTNHHRQAKDANQSGVMWLAQSAADLWASVWRQQVERSQARIVYTPDGTLGVLA